MKAKIWLKDNENIGDIVLYDVFEGVNGWLARVAKVVRVESSETFGSRQLATVEYKEVTPGAVSLSVARRLATENGLTDGRIHSGNADAADFVKPEGNWPFLSPRIPKD